MFKNGEIILILKAFQVAEGEIHLDDPFSKIFFISDGLMTMLNDKKSINSINIEGVLDDETDENCIKCKKYTALSTSITNIINNL